MSHRHPLVRLLRWECPRCGVVEDEEIGMPKDARVPVKMVETIPLTCHECEKKRASGLVCRQDAANGHPGSTPGARNRVFDSRSVAPEY